ncbi:FliM/FliN family flagellar motor switch protein [Neisseriaceae bacterium TC5R-5]|nr:FliM/FliN family flagellar motor switch protein [Neisseriaceae bacterium TC5R-5]
MSEQVYLYDAPELSDKPTSGATSSILDGKLGLLKDVKVSLDCRIGQCDISIAELSVLKAGECITLDTMPAGPVDILLAGEVIAQGSLVVVGEHYGIRIENIAKLQA